MNSEEPFEVRHYLSKTLQLFTKSTGSASEWFLSTIYLSLVVGLFPTVGHTEKAVIPIPGLLLFRLIIYVENIENLTYIASTKKTGIPTLFQKRQPAILFHAARNGQKYFAHTHTDTDTKENSEKLALICTPSLYPQPSSPKLWTFPAGCLGTDVSR